MSLTVATWNLQWQFGEWETRQPAITATLTDLAADVIMVQESWRGQVEKLAEHLGFDSTWAGHEREESQRGMGNAILSRWPIEASDFRFLEDNKGRKYRTIVSARIDTPAGILPAFTTHLDHRYDQSATRVAQLQVASEFIEEHATRAALPPIFTGDLNAVHDSDEVRKLTGRSTPYVDGRIWSDAWEQVGVGDGLTWSNENPYLEKSAWPNRRLDYVLIGWPRDMRPVGNPMRARLFGVEPVDRVVPSDHYGVAVEVHTQ